MTYIETLPRATQITGVGPFAITLHLVMCIEPMALDQTGGQAKCHRSIIAPLTWTEIERPSTNHVRQGLEASPRPKLDSGADGVSDSETKEATTEPVL